MVEIINQIKTNRTEKAIINIIENNCIDVLKIWGVAPYGKKFIGTNTLIFFSSYIGTTEVFNVPEENIIKSNLFNEFNINEVVKVIIKHYDKTN